MTETPQNQTPRYADYATIAESLRKAADAFQSLADYPAPRHPYISIDVQPGGDDDEATMAVVDALGGALLGQRGTVRDWSGVTHYRAKGFLPGISVSVYDKITSPEERKLRDEIEALRRQRDELAAAVADDEPTDRSPGDAAAAQPPPRAESR